MTDKAYAVPLHEQLARVPRDARLVIDDPDGMGTQYIPVGRMCHETAAELRRLHEVNAELMKAYRIMCNSAAGYSNYCEDSANTRRCEREFEEAEAIFCAAIAKTTGENND